MREIRRERERVKRERKSCVREERERAQAGEGNGALG